jgi:hypothetical protein
LPGLGECCSCTGWLGGYDSGMQLIYLDIDGVLNGHERHGNGYCGMYPERVEIFNSVLRRLPGCKIVVSSSWRYMVHGGSMNVEGLENLFKTHGLLCHGRILGITEPDTSADELRSVQILRDVSGRNPERWAAIDDMRLDLPESNFVKTNGEVGIVPTDAERLVSLLSE